MNRQGNITRQVSNNTPENRGSFWVSALALTIFLTLSATGCSSSLYKVKSREALAGMPATAATADVGSVTFRAAPLLTDEETQELFEANLQLAGLLPVRLEVIHNGGDAIELKKLKFKLHDAAGNEWKLISGKQAVSRILKANGVFLYNPNSRKTFEKEFRAYEFDLKSPLTHSERRRHGLIIFLSPQKEAVQSPSGVTLSVQGLTQPVALRLN